MSLLCRLGRHRPRGIPRWNDGLYFARCGRCGRDLVRTAFEGWHVPKGYRVVWSDRPPADRPDVALVPNEIPEGPVAQALEPAAAPALPDPEAAAPAGTGPAPSEPVPPPEPEPAPPPPVEADAPRGVRLPIQDVLADLAARDAAERAAETPPAPVEAPVRLRRPAWDFMDDDPPQAPPAQAAEPGRATAGAEDAQAGPAADPERQAPPLAPGASEEPEPEIRSAPRDGRSGPGEPRPLLVAGLALAIAVAVALGLYWAGYPAPNSLRSSSGDFALRDGGAGRPDGAGAADPFAASAPHIPSGEAGTAERQPKAGAAVPDEVAYVTASLLVCRVSPAEQAPRVRNLVRGREVRVLGYDGAWASLAYSGGQCWAQAQYLSPVPPL